MTEVQGGCRFLLRFLESLSLTRSHRQVPVTTDNPNFFSAFSPAWPLRGQTKVSQVTFSTVPAAVPANQAAAEHSHRLLRPLMLNLFTEVQRGAFAAGSPAGPTLPAPSPAHGQWPFQGAARASQLPWIPSRDLPHPCPCPTRGWITNLLLPKMGSCLLALFSLIPSSSLGPSHPTWLRERISPIYAKTPKLTRLWFPKCLKKQTLGCPWNTELGIPARKNNPPCSWIFQAQAHGMQTWSYRKEDSLTRKSTRMRLFSIQEFPTCWAGPES